MSKPKRDQDPEEVDMICPFCESGEDPDGYECDHCGGTGTVKGYEL